MKQEKKIKVKIEKASNWHYKEFKYFKNWNEMVDFMRKTYSMWIIDFEENEIVLTIYDDYVE